MKQVNLANVDLNLLKTFMAIWEVRSLTVAAEMLHLSQPAVSHALRRLREVFDDPLFVRTGTIMMPTDAAVQLHPAIDDALSIIRSALQRHGRFDAAASTRKFRLSMSDMSQMHIIPILAAELGRCAPGVQLETRSLPLPELDTAMRNGDVELAVGYLPGLAADCLGEELLDDHFVCMMREGHPSARQDLTVELLNELGFIHAETNVTGHGLAERAMRAAGVSRKIQVMIPHFTVAPHVVDNTDLALIVPYSIAQTMQSVGRFVLKELPFPMPPLFVKVYCHKRFQADPGIVWLRRKLIELIGQERVAAVRGAAAGTYLGADGAHAGGGLH